MRSARLAVRARAVFSSRRPSLRVGLVVGRGRPSSRGRCASRCARSCIARTIRHRARGETTTPRRDELDAVAERVVDEGARQPGQIDVAPRRGSRPRRAARAAPRASPRRAPASAGCALVAGDERIADAHVQLQLAACEPAAAPACERGGLLELGQAEQAAVERAGAAPRSPAARRPARDRCRSRPHSTSAGAPEHDVRHLSPSLPRRSRVPTMR